MFYRIGLKTGVKTEYEFERVMLFCGTGMGIHIVASKYLRVHCGVIESVPADIMAMHIAFQEKCMFENERFINASIPFEKAFNRERSPCVLFMRKLETQKLARALMYVCDWATGTTTSTGAG